MTKSCLEAAATATLVCLLALGVSGVAGAQTDDHLKCYKAKDTVKVFKKASVNLETLQAEFDTEDCEIKAGSKRICFPASKTVTEVVDGDDAPFPAPELMDVQVCYKLKCPKKDVALPFVVDQFGSRAMEKFKASMLCGPAIVN